MITPARVAKLAARHLNNGRAQQCGYRATQGITVVVREVRTTGTVIDRAVGTGATRVARPEFFVSDAARSYRDALGLAFDEARAKAQLLAERSGAKLGVALSIDENQSAEPYQQAADTSSSGAGAKVAPTPARPGQSRVEATVVVVFELIE